MRYSDNHFKYKVGTYIALPLGSMLIILDKDETGIVKLVI